MWLRLQIQGSLLQAAFLDHSQRVHPPSLPPRGYCGFCNLPMGPHDLVLSFLKRSQAHECLQSTTSVPPSQGLREIGSTGSWGSPSILSWASHLVASSLVHSTSSALPHSGTRILTPGRRLDALPRWRGWPRYLALAPGPIWAGIGSPF